MIIVSRRQKKKKKLSKKCQQMEEKKDAKLAFYLKLLLLSWCDSVAVYLHNPPRRPQWSKSKPEPRVIDVFHCKEHVVLMDAMASPPEHRARWKLQPEVSGRGSNQWLRATADNKQERSGNEHAWRQLSALSLFCSMFSPFSLASDWSLLLKIFQSPSLLEMVHILCRLRDNNIPSKPNSSCKHNLLLQLKQFFKTSNLVLHVYSYHDSPDSRPRDRKHQDCRQHSGSHDGNEQEESRNNRKHSLVSSKVVARH